MFFRWFEPFGYMNKEVGEQESQTDTLSQKLFALTFWGDYGGDMFSRYHFELVREMAPNIIYETNAMHGKGWTLGNINDNVDELREVVRFVAHFDPKADNFVDYPLYEEDGYCEWEYEQTQKEITKGWWGQYEWKELQEALGDWENTLAGETQEDFAAIYYEYGSAHEWEGIEEYWEGADSLVVHGWDAIDVADWLLEQYAEEITNAGNPPALIEV